LGLFCIDVVGELVLDFIGSGEFFLGVCVGMGDECLRVICVYWLGCFFFVVVLVCGVILGCVLGCGCGLILLMFGLMIWCLVFIIFISVCLCLGGGVVLSCC